MDLVVTGCVAVSEDGTRLGKGGGAADLEYALASTAGLIGPDTVVVTTVHELQVRPAGSIPAAAHDVPVDLIVTPERIIDCRGRRGPRPIRRDPLAGTDRSEDRRDTAARRGAAKIARDT